jgi:hypothetical protein
MTRKIINFNEKIYLVKDEIAYEAKLSGLEMGRHEESVEILCLFQIIEGPLSGRFKTICLSSTENVKDRSEESREIHLIGNEIDIRMIGYDFYKDSIKVKDNSDVDTNHDKPVRGFKPKPIIKE